MDPTLQVARGAEETMSATLKVACGVKASMDPALKVARRAKETTPATFQVARGLEE